MRLWPWRRKSATSSLDLWREIFGGRASNSGANVNWKTALEASTSLACARVIAEGLAQVPCKVMVESAGVRAPAREHALYSLLARKPNDWQTSFEFREQMGLHLVLCGNFFAFKNVVRGRVVELLPFEPGQVKVSRGADGVLAYEVRVGELVQQIPAAQMWHVRGPSWNGWMGLEGVHLAREAIGLALATEEHAARSFSNGAALGGILSADGNLTPDQVTLLRKSWEETQGGTANAYKTAILWGGLKWSPRAMENDKAQLIEQRKFQVEEICRMFRVMPIMVGYSDKAATYASAEQMFLAHVVHTLGPWYERIEQSAEVNLLSEQDIRGGHYVKFVANGLLRGAAKDRAEYYAKALGAGGAPSWMTQDEVRALEDMNPMGGDAARLPVATNVPKPPAGGTGDDDATP